MGFVVHTSWLESFKFYFREQDSDRRGTFSARVPSDNQKVQHRITFAASSLDASCRNRRRRKAGSASEAAPAEAAAVRAHVMWSYQVAMFPEEVRTHHDLDNLQ